MFIEGRLMPVTSVMPTLTWAPPSRVRHALNGLAMGTRYSAVFGAGEGVDTQTIAVALQAAVDAVDQQMSNWIATSDVSRLNAAPLGQWIKIARHTVEVVETGLEIGRRSGGAFDIAVGAAVNAWGFGPFGKQPDSGAIAHTSQAGAAPSLDVDGTNACLRRLLPMQLDLCGIAKGFGVDELARTLDAFGIADYLVSIDGEVRAKGFRPDGTGWRVAVEKPDLRERSATKVVTLTNRAIATSGDYRHRRVHDCRTVSHSIDPHTGRPVANDLASVSVMAANCMVADAWATALLVAGPINGPALADANTLDALFILRDGDDCLELAVGAFA